MTKQENSSKKCDQPHLPPTNLHKESNKEANKETNGQIPTVLLTLVQKFPRMNRTKEGKANFATDAAKKTICYQIVPDQPSTVVATVGNRVIFAQPASKPLQTTPTADKKKTTNIWPTNWRP